MEQSIEVGDVWIAKDQPDLEIEVFVISGDTVVCKLAKDWGGYVKGELVTYTKNTLFRIYAKEVDKACFDAYQEGYRFGHSDAKKEYEEKYKSEFVEVRQHHYDMGYNDALSHMASEEAENALELKKQGYEEGYEEGYGQAIEEMKLSKGGIGHLLGEEWDKGYNTAIKEMSNNQALGETTECEFGTEDCCEQHNPNKETQEAMQEVLDRDANEFSGVWVAKDGSGKLKIVSVNEGTCDVELVEYIKDLFLCAGDTATISVEDLKEHWTKERAEYNYTTTEDDQLQKELKLVEKYPHYYKDIRHLNIIDIYRFFDLFEVTDPCIQHSVKKLAVGGKRGSKDYEKDIKEAMDTLKRWEYMQEENKRGGGLDD